MVIFIISLTATLKPGLFSIVNHIPYGDTAAHFFLFGFLGWSIAINFRRYGPFYIGFGLMLTACYAVVDEFMQLAFSSRTFSILDLVADLSGIFVFSVVGYLYAMKSRLCGGVNKEAGSS